MSEASQHIDKNEFQKYLKGELRGEAAHNMEKKLLDSWFATEAMEGAEKIGGEVFSSDVTALQSKVSQRIRKKPSSYKMSGILKIAASIVLLAAVSFFIFQLTKTSTLPSNELSIAESKDFITDSLRQDSSLIAFNQTPIPEEDELTEAVELDQPAEEIVEEEIASEPLGTELDDEEASGFAADLSLDQIVEDSSQFKNQNLADMAGAESLEIGEEQAKLEEATLNRSKSVAQSEPAARKIAEEFTPTQAGSVASSQRADNINFRGKKVRGRVFAKDGKDPLSGVAVIESGTSNSSVTNSMGEFTIDLESETKKLQFNYGGFRSMNIDIVDSTNLEIFLVPNTNSPSDISIVGNSNLMADGTFTPAQPTNGNRSYRQYLESNLNYPQAAIDAGVEGNVIVQVSVSEDGTLSNFEVTKSLGSGCDEEAIRLIKEGPSWIPSKLGSNILSENVRITVRFNR